jgi:hypothetical protein
MIASPAEMPVTGGQLVIQGGVLEEEINTFLMSLDAANVRRVSTAANTSAKYGNRLLLQGQVVYEVDV